MKNPLIYIKAIPIFILSGILYLLISPQKRTIIKKDYLRWGEWQKLPISLWGFSLLFAHIKEFRNVVYKRLGHLSVLFSWFLPRQNNLTIACEDIGSGMIIQHGYSTVICAEKIGRNFWVNQCVNIVWNGDKRCTIGDNVMVCAGAIIVGGVIIGSNVTIGAGAVVVKDIPSDCLVVGNPARIIKK